MQIARGTLVSGYEILEPLGRGGQSTVYKALDVTLRRVVAIKFLSDQNLADEMSQKRFLLEAQALSSLNHPNIATVYHIGQFDAHPFIVMEYVEGQTLLDHLGTRSANLEGKLALMMQITEAVAFAHSQGILHRDLKPGNILVTPDGRVKLVDFGLAKLTQDALKHRLSAPEELTTTGSILGTVSYLSPEQARSEPIDERSDLFSLGIIFYEMLTGRRPYNADSPVSTLVAIIQAPPESFPAGPAVPGEVQAVVMKLLEKRPEQRYASAPDLLGALRLAAGIPLDTTMRFPPLRQRPAARRRRRWIAAAAAAALLAAALAAWWFFLRPAPADGVADRRIAIFVYPVRSGGDEKSRFLADLITGEVIATLNRSADLRILHLPDSGANPAAAERVLQRENVRYIIDGSLLLAGDNLKVSMKMIDRTDSSIRWSDSLRGAITDIYAIPVRIAASAAFVAGVYVAADKMNFPGREAFELYTQGDILLRRYDPSQLATAIEYFRKCIDVAPDFLPAYARIVHGFMQYHNQGISYDPAYLDEALGYIRRGLAKDPRSPALRTAQAWYHLFTYNYAAAAAVVRGIEHDGLQPTDEKLLVWIRFYDGDTEGAMETLRRATASNPLDASLPLNQVVLGAMTGRREAVEAANQEAEQMSASPLLRGVTSGWWRMSRGEYDEAARVFDETYSRHGLHLLALACAEAEFARGDDRRCLRYLDAWLGKNPFAMEGHWLRCLCLARLGDDSGLRSAARAAAEHAARLNARHRTPGLAVYALYFAVRSGDTRMPADAIRAVDVRGQDTFTRYLHAVTRARLGERGALELAPTPYSPVYWLNRFAQVEREEIQKVR